MYILAPNRLWTFILGTEQDVLTITSISFFFNTSDTLSNTGHKTVPLDNKKKTKNTQSFVLRAEQQSCVSLGGEMG